DGPSHSNDLAALRGVRTAIGSPPGSCNDLRADAIGDCAYDRDDHVGATTAVNRDRRIEVPRGVAFDGLVCDTGDRGGIGVANGPDLRALGGVRTAIDDLPGSGDELRAGAVGDGAEDSQSDVGAAASIDGGGWIKRPSVSALDGLVMSATEGWSGGVA